MNTFKDKNGYEWRLEISVATLRKVRKHCGFDVCSAVKIDEKGRPDTSGLERLATDPVLLVDVIYCICEDQAREAKISDEDFGRGMNGDAIETATWALLSEISEIMTKEKRLIMKRLIEKTKQAQAALAARIEQTLNDGSFDAAVEKALSTQTTAVNE